MSNALIIGASGLVGNYLYRVIFCECNTTGTFQNHSLDNLIHLDIADRNALKQIIYDLRPDFIFLAAAFTNVDLCEEKKELCFKVNVQGAHNVVDILKHTKAKLIYFSSDYIFNGQNGPYSEGDKSDPLSIYGKSKLEGEKIISNTLDNFLIIRTTCVYGWETQQKNFVFNLIKKINSKETVNVPIDQITTPTYSGNLAQIVWQLVKLDKKGIYNVVGSSLMSRLEFALLIAEIFDLDKTFICGVKTEQMYRKAKRPLNGGLKIDKIKKELDLDIQEAREGLLQMKKEVENGFRKYH